MISHIVSQDHVKENKSLTFTHPEFSLVHENLITNPPHINPNISF